MKQTSHMKIKCLRCGDIIEGDRKGTYIQCSCREIAIDQTSWCTRIIGIDDNWEEVRPETPYHP